MFKKAMTTLILGGMLAFPLATITPAPDAQASGCPSGQICDGTGNGGGGSSGGGSNSGGGSSGGGSSGGGSNSGGGSSGGGGDGSTWKHVFSSIWVKDCKVRNDGAEPVKMKISYKQIFKNTDEKVKPDSRAWKYEGYYPSIQKHAWSYFEHQSSTCLYGSAYVSKNLTCYISASVSIDKRRPTTKNILTKTVKTGYKEGSKNYDNCKSSRSVANAGVKLTEYGTYDTHTWLRATNMTVKVPVTANEYTGKYDKLKVVSVSPAYTTPKKLGMTASLDCKNQFRSPAVVQPKYWTEDGCAGSFASSFICEKPDVKVDISDTNARKWKTVKTGQTLQMLREGKTREIKFDQRIKGQNIKVKSVKTRYERSGTPWDSSLPLNRNLLEVRTSTGKGLMDSKSTRPVTGSSNSVFVRSYQASNPNSKTQIGQVLEWSGTKKIQSVEITEVDALTGKFKTRTVTVQVPTSGTCSQSIGLEYIRSIGDVQ